MSESDLSADVVVIGAGHNALITAGYLAKAGLEVAVLEAKSIIGGNTVTEELTFAGWQHDSCSSAHAVIQSNPVLRDDELGLIAQYGLRYAYTEPAAVLPLEDGDSFVLHRSAEGTAEEIARFSRHDASRFIELVGEWSVLKSAHRRWNAGLPAGDDQSGIAYEALRRQSAWDVVHKEFEHEVTRRVLLWMGFATFQPPTRGGTGALPISITSGRLEFGWATPMGGSGALPAALAALIEDHGGHVLVDSAVSRIFVSQGRAHGVETHDGRRIRARIAVVSSAHLTTLPEMLGAEAPEDLTAASAAWRPGISLFAVHAALRRDIRYRVGGQSITSTSGGLGSPDGIRRQVAGCSTGEPEMDDPWMLMVSSTAVDPDRAPGGTFKILTCAPEHLAGGESWDSFGSRYAERLLALAGRHVDGLDEADVLAVVPETPASLARRNPHNIAGSCHGGEFLLPSGEYIPGWPSHASSLEGLFLTGSTAHPGGSVSGWPGRNAARAVLSAAGIDPAAVMGGLAMAGLTPLRLGLFSPSLPHLVAVREGYYAERGVTVQQRRIPSSAALLRALQDGDLDVALTSPDNIANFRLNKVDDGPVDARIIAAVDQAGSISLMGRPGIDGPGQIRRGAVAVDARNSGFAFLLYELLNSVGLAPDIDYRVLEAGGTPRRFEALLKGSFEATILNAGFDVRAQAEGGSLLVPTVDVIPDYLSTVLAARGEYLDQAPGSVSRFVSGYRQAMNDCLDPARHADCTDLVVSEWQVSPDVAARMVDAAADARTGVVPDAVIRPAQLEVVLELRKRWGGFSEDVDIAAEIRRPRGLIDERFARVA